MANLTIEFAESARQLYIVLTDSVCVQTAQTLLVAGRSAQYDERLDECKRNPPQRSPKWFQAIEEVCRICAPNLCAFGLMLWKRSKADGPLRGAGEVLALRKQIIPSLLRMRCLETLFLPNVCYFFTTSTTTTTTTTRFDSNADEDNYYGLNMLGPTPTDDHVLPVLRSLYVCFNMCMGEESIGSLQHRISASLWRFKFVCARIRRVVLYGGCPLKKWRADMAKTFYACFQQAVVVVDANLEEYRFSFVPNEPDYNTEYFSTAAVCFDTARSLSIHLSNWDVRRALMNNNKHAHTDFDVLQNQIEHIAARGSCKWTMHFLCEILSLQDANWQHVHAVLKYWQQGLTAGGTKLSLQIWTEVPLRNLLDRWTYRASAPAADNLPNGQIWDFFTAKSCEEPHMLLGVRDISPTDINQHTR